MDNFKKLASSLENIIKKLDEKIANKKSIVSSIDDEIYATTELINTQISN